MSPTTITIGILALAGVAVLVFLYWNESRRREVTDVPPGMRPAYSDEQLESNVLERWLGWGLVLTLFFAVFFPVYWWREHGRLTSETREGFVAEVVQGEALFQENCSQCHGSNGRGGAAPSPHDTASQWPAPDLLNIVARYEENRNVVDIEAFLRQTITFGRPGTPMPPWGREGDGPLTDAEVDALMKWILANQVEEVAEADPAAGMSGEQLYQENCVFCHGPDLQGSAASERPGPPLVNVFERHSRESVLGVLRNGIVVPTGAIMPPWQEGYMHARYTDDALQRIIDYLEERQEAEPATPDEGAAEGQDADEAPEDDSIQARAPRA